MGVIRRVDRYELIEEVGTGGMAVVYRGHDTALDREVAVKLLHPHLAARAESRARFSREARAVARLRHPNIVEIYDYAGDAALESYLVTEFVRGRTLRAFAEQEGVGLPEVAALLSRALADALAHAHGAGVIHRDLKPENVLVLEDGTGPRALKLVDFGIARILASDDRMTMTGALVGSPNHMAPEIVEGREADARSDVFSLGTILYWLATGVLPFDAPNPTATLRRLIEGAYTDPRQVCPLVSDEIADVLARALAPDPALRLPSAAAFCDALDAALRRCGLADPEAELRSFLEDPASYKRALRGRLAATALAEADAALAHGQTARGMKLLDRVLALDPDDARVAARLARMALVARWRRRCRRGLVAALAVGGLGATGFGLVALRAERRVPAPANGAAAPPPPAAARDRADPAPELSEPRRARAAHPPRATSLPERRPAARVAAADPAPPPQEAERTSRPIVVAVHVSPYAQRALLDGVEVARGEGRVSFTLSPGQPHRIRIEHACCYPFVRDFPADASIPQPLELKERLRPLPARLRVEGDPQASVFVDGRLVGSAGDSQRAPLAVPVPATGANPYEAVAELRLERQGHAPVRATLKLRAGADVTFAATEPEGPVSAAPADLRGGAEGEASAPEPTR